MKIAIVGFPTVGKTTLFNLLTEAGVSTSRFGTPGRAETHVGVSRVIDDRLTALSALFSPKKTTPATVDYVDLVGIRKDTADTGGVAAEARNADALMHVVRAFRDEDLPHPEGAIDPARDIDTMEMELILADHAIAERRIEKLKASIAKTHRPEEKQELALLTQLLAGLEEETPIRSLSLGAEEQRLLRGFAFLSAKPILHVVNLGEDDVGHVADFETHFDLGRHRSRPHTALLPLSARIEQEIAELPAADAAIFQDDLGIPDPCRPRVIHASYALLGLISFFTVGADECRAWSVPEDTPARSAAAVIHTDIERGFIRAEVVPCPALLEAGSLAAAREKGLLRLEGKDYPVADGDVINFRFNV
ncbi:MAG: redox-regulated ATPase YchF [Acidobacteriota bacterium]